MDQKILKRSPAELFSTFCVMMFLAFIAWIFLMPIETEDIWWHLATGRWIAEHGKAPIVDVFSFRDSPGPWVLTQAGGSSLLYAVYTFGQEAGLIGFRSLYFAAAIGLILVYAYKKFPLELLIPLIVILPLEMFASRSHLRPYLFNYLFIQIFLIILAAYRDGRIKKSVWILPLLSAAWFNLHLGAFIYGTGIIGVFIISSLIQAVQSKQKPVNFNKPAMYLGLLIAHWMAFVLNPYGLEGALYPLKAFFDADFVVKGLILNTITELRPPVYVFTPAGWKYSVMFFVVVLALIKSKKNQMHNTLLYLFATGLFLYGQRGVIFWAIAGLYIIIDAAEEREFYKQWYAVKKIRFCTALLILSTVAGCWMHASNKLNDKVITDAGTHTRSLLITDTLRPKNAVSFMHAYGITGNIYNWDGYGGYLLWRSYPEIRPIVDGRQADPDAFELYLQLIETPELFTELEEEFDVRAALLNSSYGTQYKLIDYLVKRPDWQLVHIDGPAMVFVQKGAYTLPAKIAQFENRIRNQIIHDAGLQYISAEAKDLNGITDIKKMKEGVALFTAGFYAEGLKRMRHAALNSRSAKAVNIYNRSVDAYRKIRTLPLPHK